LANKIKFLLLILLPILCFLGALLIGRYEIELMQVVETLKSKLIGSHCNVPEEIQLIILEIRMPRAILAALVGGSLATGGAAFQGLFCNPLVDSGILGVSAGAGFGAALSIILFGVGGHTIWLSFCFGCLAVGLSYIIGRIYRTATTIMLVLGGVVVSSIFSALLSFLKYVADPYSQLPAIVFWLMGSLATAGWDTLMITVIPMVIGVAGLVVMRWRLNILSMGDREAQSLGINVTLNKGMIILFATLATAGAVCACGIIGWVGLVLPHIGRMLLGSDNKILVPACISLGAVFMILVDTVSRTFTGSEIPLGIITALIGGPFFIYLLKKTRGGGW
jgi:iron complex transport system permease protein